MKVFISWSGERSKKIAAILGKWIKQVINIVEPFVSSQDIDKGSRWSTDIAKELQDTNFGILCVTKDNYQQPWLLFEAGALSKSLEIARVAPVLFDLSHSDLPPDSPLLQFQQTSFSEDEIKKLIVTLNKACGQSAREAHELDEAFSVWYPQLISNLSSIGSEPSEADASDTVVDSEKTVQILEELLDLTRTNQKLLRNPDTKTTMVIESVSDKIDALTRKTENVSINNRRAWKFHPRVVEELIQLGKKPINSRFAFLFLLSIYRDSFPWVYDFGKELQDVLISKKPKIEKINAIQDFKEMLDFTTHVFVESDNSDISIDNLTFLREISMIISRYTDELVNNED